MARTGKETAQVILDYARVLSRDFSIDYNAQVAASEMRAAYRNAAMANLLRCHNTIRHAPDDLLAVYCHPCLLEMSCTELARTFMPIASQSGEGRVGDK